LVDGAGAGDVGLSAVVLTVKVGGGVGPVVDGEAGPVFSLPPLTVRVGGVVDELGGSKLDTGGSDPTGVELSVLTCLSLMFLSSVFPVRDSV